jgi:hypothetical protein
MATMPPMERQLKREHQHQENHTVRELVADRGAGVRQQADYESENGKNHKPDGEPRRTV